MKFRKTVDYRTPKRIELAKCKKVPDLNEEKWAPIKEHEQLYAVSNYGRIKSLFREIKGKNGICYRYSEKLHTPQVDEHGYHRVTFRKNTIPKQWSVHRLVADHFMDNPKNLPQVNHKNGDKSDNNINNLEWCTASQNMQHGYDELDHERMRGEKNGMTKLTPELIVLIKKSYSELKSFTKTGLQFGISGTHVWRIVKNKSWEHLYEN